MEYLDRLINTYPQCEYVLVENGVLKILIEDQKQIRDMLESVVRELINGINRKHVEILDSLKARPDSNSNPPETLYIKPKDKTLKPKSSKTKDSIESFISEDSPIAEPTIGISGSSGLEIKPPLIRRRNFTPIEFEKTPRQRYRAEVLDIINYWNSSPGLVHHKLPPYINGRWATPTKIFMSTVSTIGKVMDGKFFSSVGLSKHDRPYTKEEIIIAIDRFKLMVNSPNYLPVEKTGIRFIVCLTEEPKLVVSVVERQKEKNPQLTEWLKEAYIEKVLLGVSKEFNRIEENKIIKGANQLHELIRRIQGRLNMMTRPIEWCNMTVDCLIDRWGKDGIYIGHLASEYTYNDTLIRYLKKKGRLD
jgi:hypothetical protein